MSPNNQHVEVGVDREDNIFSFRYVGGIDAAIEYYERLMAQVVQQEPEHLVTLEEFFKRRGIQI